MLKTKKRFFKNIFVQMKQVRDPLFFQLTKKMKATLSKTKFKDAPIVPVAAKPSSLAEDKENGPIGQTRLPFGG